MYKLFFKRVIDFVFAFLLLTALMPIIFLTGLLLALANKGEAFFVQPRPGKNERIFKLLKFKTMNDNRDDDDQLLPDDQRITSVGKWVRKFSLDELPQLYNVLKGEMSLIGPRPWLVEYLPLYNDFQRQRHLVKPGITGWAQVNGRNMASWDKRFEFDVYYVDNVSFKLDFKIFVLTIWKIIGSKDVSGENTMTMTKFEGNE